MESFTLTIHCHVLGGISGVCFCGLGHEWDWWMGKGCSVGGWDGKFCAGFSLKMVHCLGSH